MVVNVLISIECRSEIQSEVVTGDFKVRVEASRRCPHSTHIQVSRSSLSQTFSHLSLTKALVRNSSS